jgi:hypothetical protein
MILGTLFMKLAVTGVTSLVISRGGTELNPLSQVSLAYFIESFVAVAGAIVFISLFIKGKGVRLVLYSFVMALTAFDLAWDVSQVFHLPVFSGIMEAAFITAAIPTFTALYVQQNMDLYSK